jgi:hypothetical protein
MNSEESKELELTDEMLKRNDEIDNAVYDCIRILSEQPNLPWSMEIIAEVTEAVAGVLSKFKIKVRHPAIATKVDGTQYYSDD